jgi:hypothetical protein
MFLASFVVSTAYVMVSTRYAHSPKPRAAFLELRASFEPRFWFSLWAMVGIKYL